MKLFSCDVTLNATAYIKAETVEEAHKIMKAMNGLSPILPTHHADIPISGLQYDDPALPAVSFSPAMGIDTNYSEIFGDHEDNVPFSDDDKQQVEHLLALGGGYAVESAGDGKYHWRDKHGGESDVRFDAEELAWADAYAAMKMAEG